MEKDWNRIAQLEKAISAKFGDEAIKNPKQDWDPEKEKDYHEQVKVRSEKMKVIDEQEQKIEVKGFFISKKLLNREVKINCSVCSKKLSTIRDDVCVNKYDCCEECYINYIEGREDRWLEGWRPGED